MPKIIVPYDHDPANLGKIEMAIADEPEESDWVPALRDTVDGNRVVWIRSNQQGSVWVRDRNGTRLVRRKRR